MGNRKIKKVLISIIVMVLGSFAFCATDFKNILWDDYVVLRDAVYNSEAPAVQLMPLYEKAKSSAKTLFTSGDLYVALSRCDYIMGRAYSYENNKDKAGEFYDSGSDYAEKAIDICDCAPARLMIAENISQNCSVKPVSYAITMGTKVGGLAKDVLKHDPQNGAALYMKSAQYIYAPSPFHNYKKGIKEMKEILDDKSVRLEKDDLFNITSAIGYGYMGKKEYEDAEIWLKKSLVYYPNNNYVNGLLNDIKNK